MANICPICGHPTLGKIGFNRYFCPECCHEINLSGKNPTCYYPGEDGDIRLAGRVIDVAKSYREAHRITS